MKKHLRGGVCFFGFHCLGDVRVHVSHFALKEECVLNKFMEYAGKHLKMPKHFIPNEERLTDLNQACDIAEKLFGDMKISIEGDPLEMGALTLCIKGMDIVVRGESEIELFATMLFKADNFEIYPSEDGIEFNILFNRALIRV